MDKKTLWGASLIGALVIALAIFLFFKQSSDQINVDDLSAKITYYYGDTCPHCLQVLQFLEENKIAEKVNFTKKEVYNNTLNSQELLKVAQKCGLKTSEVGVPFLYAEGKCLVGGEEVINFFKEKAGITQ